MVKKLLTLALGLMLGFGAMAQDPVDATIAFEDIHYWVGEGTDSAVLIINYGVPDTAFAWGYLFNGTTTASEMLSAIATADPRLSLEGDDPSIDGDILFAIGENDTLRLSPVDPNLGYNFWWTNLNGVSAGAGAASTLHNGDVFKYGDMNSAIGWDYQYGYYLEEAWTKEPTPVFPVVYDATFAASEILYWVGEGSNQMIFVVNWADTSLAWGYRFSTETVSLATVMDDIEAADSRIVFDADGYLNDITFNDGNVSLSITSGNYWEQKINGEYGMGMSETIHNGDLNLWADPAAGVQVGETDWGGGYITPNYAYPMEIHPVSVPTDPEWPDVQDATIAEEAILFWVGEGDNKMRFVVNWADTSLAWGYKFATETVSLQTVMDDIAAVDSRFSYTGEGFVNDILFNDGTVNLSITPGNWWEQKINGEYGAGLTQTIHNGDLNLWADPAAGVQVGETDWGGGYVTPNYAYPMAITPVSAPNGINEATAISVSIYPNPASSRFNVVCGGLENETEAMLYDMTGRKVYSQTVNAGTTSIMIETSNLANGVYMLHMGGNTTKVVVRH